MLKFIEQDKNEDENGNEVDTDSRAWGNYYDTKPLVMRNGYYKSNFYDASNYINASITELLKNADVFFLLQTGAYGEITGEHPKNLYDVAGNLWEWTSEKASAHGGSGTAVGNPLHRGGGFDGSRSTAYRSASSGVERAIISLGFRVVLYIL